MKLELDKYEILKPYFESNDVNCAAIARETGISQTKVVTYYSMYLSALMAKQKAARERANIPLEQFQLFNKY